MKCREILLAIRKQREVELAEYKNLCAKIKSPVPGYPENLIKHRQIILTLDLPLNIDTPSVGATLSKKPFIPNFERRHSNKWIGHQSKGPESQYKKQKTITFLKKQSIWPTAIPFEELPYLLSRETLSKAIEQTNLSAGSKKVYRSLSISMLEFATAQEAPYPTISHSILSADVLAAYFQYIEQRCLKSKSEKTYRNLLEVRLLFYLSLTCTQLNTLTIADLEDNEKKYLIPPVYIDLAKTLFLPEETIFNRDAKRMHRFVEQSAKAAGLKDKITPSRIKQSLSAICHREGLLH